MDKVLLRTAQQNLRITDVALRDSRCLLADRFEPKYEHPEMDVQLLQRTTRSEILETKDGDRGEHKLFRVFVELGIRWVRRPAKPRTRKRVKAAVAVTTKTEPEVLARIEATFIAEYEIAEPTDKPALDEFAIYNAPWNVWPFWREYVTSQCNRMNLPKATMPLQGLRPRKKPVAAPSGTEAPNA